MFDDRQVITSCVQDMYGDTRFSLCTSMAPQREEHVMYTFIFDAHRGTVIGHTCYRPAPGVPK